MQLPVPSARFAPHLLTALSRARTTLTAGLLTVVVGLGAVQGLPGGAFGAEAVREARAHAVGGAPHVLTGVPGAAETEALLARYRCSSTGFGDDATPRSAIVRAPGGDLRLVGLAAGWEAVTGTAAGDLLAVCLPPVR